MNSENKAKTLQADDCILVCIDIQDKLLPAIADKEKLIDNTVKLLKLANIIGLPVICTEQQNLGATIPQIKQAIENFKPINKIEFSCYQAIDFLTELHKSKRKSLIVIGIETHICVLQTVLHAMPDYTVHVVKEAVSSRTLENKKAGLARMRQKGAIITTTEMLLFELLQKAGTDQFREARKLIL